MDLLPRITLAFLYLSVDTLNGGGFQKRVQCFQWVRCTTRFVEHLLNTCLFRVNFSSFPKIRTTCTTPVQQYSVVHLSHTFYYYLTVFLDGVQRVHVIVSNSTKIFLGRFFEVCESKMAIRSKSGVIEAKSGRVEGKSSGVKNPDLAFAGDVRNSGVELPTRRRAAAWRPQSAAA